MIRNSTPWSVVGVAVFVGCGGVGEDSARGEAVLTLEDVAAATGLPSEAIEQQAFSGCLYSWDDGTVWMSSVRVHESVDRARSYYATFTEDVTAEEVGVAEEEVKDELSDREAAGELTATEGAAGRTITDAMPERDYVHRSLPGIGNEASYDGRGTVYMRCIPFHPGNRSPR